MRTRPELVATAIQHIQHGRDGGLGAIRVDAAQVEQLRYDVSFKESAAHHRVVDEPAQRGGTAAGPTPLEFFLTGALTCLMNQFIKLSLARHLPLDNLKGTVRAHIRHAVEGSLTDMIFDVYLQGRATADVVRALTVDAERYCYVHNTLKTAIPLTVHVHLNGQHLLDQSSTPSPSHAPVGPEQQGTSSPTT